MPAYRVLLTDRPWEGWVIEEEVFDGLDVEIVTPEVADEDSLIEAASGVDAIGTCWADVTGAVIRAAPDCKVVTRFGIGLDNIDVVEASRLGIPVTNVPDYCISEVADHAMALMLGMARNVGWFLNDIRAGRWELMKSPPMRRLSKQTIGIAGLGRIGQAIMKRAMAFDARVIGWNRSRKDLPIEHVTFDELIAASDFLVLAVPLTPETAELIDAEVLKAMKSSAVLINPSRGGLVDQDALWSAIQKGEIAGAGLDVLEKEPPDFSNPMFRDPRVIVTPHAAFVSEESVIELRHRAAGQIRAILEGKVPENVVNQ